MNVMEILRKFREQSRSRFSVQPDERNETIKMWQARFFASLMMYVMPLSVIIYVPNFIMCLIEGLPLLAMYDTLAFLTVQIIYFNKTLSLQNRKIILLVNFYILGLILLFYLGWMGPGLMYLFGVSALAALIISSKAGFITFALNTLVFAVIAFISHSGLRAYFDYLELTPGAILAVGLNYVILNLTLVNTISSLTNGLRKKIISEQNIRERLHNEVLLHKISRKKAEESDRLKSAFLANMSHEIRTPMNGVLGFVELLKQPDLSGNNQQKFIRLIEKSGKKLLYVLNDLIDISKIDSNQMELNITEKNIIDNIHFAHAFYAPKAIRKNLEFQLSIPQPNKYELVKTDHDKIRAILGYLINNAIKYTHVGSIEIGCKKNETHFDFFVKDSGIGIAEERKEAIFDRFVQADIEDKQALAGSGLGLSISRAYIEMLGGKIWVESKSGKGSTFRFTVPINR
jgi:signal transduction histidine kinase